MKRVFRFNALTEEQRYGLLRTEMCIPTPYMRADITPDDRLVLHVPDEQQALRLHRLAERALSAGIVTRNLGGDPTLLTYSEHAICRPIETLEELEQWMGERWLYPADSVEAYDHFMGKTGEEIHELKQAILQGDPDAVLGELGDVVYCMFGCARSLGIDLNKELALHTSVEHLYGESGTISLGDLTVGSLEIKWPTLSHKVIEDLSDESISKGVSSFDMSVCLTTASSLVSVQGSACRVFGNLIRKLGEEVRYDPWVQVKASRIEATAFAMLQYTALVAKYFGRDINDVIKMLQVKQLNRIRAGESLTRLVVDNP